MSIRVPQGLGALKCLAVLTVLKPHSLAKRAHDVEFLCVVGDSKMRFFRLVKCNSGCFHAAHGCKTSVQSGRA